MPRALSFSQPRCPSISSKWINMNLRFTINTVVHVFAQPRPLADIWVMYCNFGEGKPDLQEGPWQVQLVLELGGYLQGRWVDSDM